jgi:large subunit ribosomal protein L24
MEMKIKKGDMVKVIAGKDKGKTGKVLRTYPKDNKVVVEGVNVQTKHAKATRNTPAEIKHIEGPIDASNVMYYDTKAKKASRVGYKVKEDGTKVRVSKKTGNVID